MLERTANLKPRRKIGSDRFLMKFSKSQRSTQKSTVNGRPVNSGDGEAAAFRCRTDGGRRCARARAASSPAGDMNVATSTVCGGGGLVLACFGDEIFAKVACKLSPKKEKSVNVATSTVCGGGVRCLLAAVTRSLQKCLRDVVSGGFLHLQLRLVVPVSMAVLDSRNMDLLESYGKNTTRPYKTNHVICNSDLPLAMDGGGVNVASSTVYGGEGSGLAFFGVEIFAKVASRRHPRRILIPTASSRRPGSEGSLRFTKYEAVRKRHERGNLDGLWRRRFDARLLR
ncbi:unnamed protein product [Cochlearia groenlandica]